MPLVPMKDMLTAAKAGKYAVGAFNIVDYATLQAVVDAAEEERAPAIIQTSASSTVKYYGCEALADMARNVAGKSDMPFALHLDHCKDLDMVFECIDTGWTSVMYDGSSFSFEKNLAESKQVVARAHAQGVSVEGEIGAVWGVEDDIDVDESEGLLADPDKAVEYAEASGVDAFAPAIGTAHGLYKGEPKIDFERLKTIAERVEAPIVIHGGTGLSEEVFRRVIALGGAKVNISTQIKLAVLQKTGFLRDSQNPELPLGYCRLNGLETGLIHAVGLLNGWSGHTAMKQDARFWEEKTLDAMSPAEWERLCDRCARCCVLKEEDEDTGDIVYTNIACRYLDLDNCRCTCYAERKQRVPQCVQLSPDRPGQFKWLPAACAYRLLHEGRPLPVWHPLVSGHPDSTRDAGMSARNRLISETEALQQGDPPPQ